MMDWRGNDRYQRSLKSAGTIFSEVRTGDLDLAPSVFGHFQPVAALEHPHLSWAIFFDSSLTVAHSPSISTRPTMRIPMKSTQFMSLGRRITHRAGPHRCFSTEYRRFRAFFGVSPSSCALVWGKIRTFDLAPRARPVHLLWALLFLNLYDPEEVIAGFLGVDEQTYREWSFEVVKVIAKLKPHYVSCLRAIRCMLAQYCSTVAHCLFHCPWFGASVRGADPMVQPTPKGRWQEMQDIC